MLTTQSASSAPVVSVEGVLELFLQVPVQECVKNCERLVERCHESSEPLKSACSAAAFVKVTRQLSDLDSTLEDVRLSADSDTAQRDLETYHMDNYDNLLQVWMPLSLYTWLLSHYCDISVLN